MSSAEQPFTRMLEFVPYSPEMDERIVEFNRRLAEARVETEFRLRVGPGSLLFEPNAETVWEERYLALEGDTVRGGVVLQVQPFHVDGEIHTVANIQLPLAEGIVDRRYAYVGVWLIKHVLRRYPRCFALGMGAEDRPLSLLLRSMGFAVWSVPFYFMVANVSRAVRELPPLGPPGRRRVASTLLRVTGVGAIASHGWRAVAGKRRRGVATHRVEEWGVWADTVWEQARHSLSVGAVRDARTLAALFPTGDSQFPALRLDEDGRTFGWAVVGLRQMVDNLHFGSLNVGTIVDALTVPGRETAALHAATRFLLDRGADVVVTNQSHPAWRAACRRARYLGARSNYVLAASRALLPAGVDIASHGVQFTRGDGDGRVHL
jgi:hypothetical protein